MKHPWPETQGFPHVSLGSDVASMMRTIGGLFPSQGCICKGRGVARVRQEQIGVNMIYFDCHGSESSYLASQLGSEPRAFECLQFQREADHG